MATYLRTRFFLRHSFCCPFNGWNRRLFSLGISRKYFSQAVRIVPFQKPARMTKLCERLPLPLLTQREYQSTVRHFWCLFILKEEVLVLSTASDWNVCRLDAVGPVSFWISGGTSWLLEPPPVTYLDRSVEKFPVNFEWGRQSSWEQGFGPNKFLTLTRSLQMNPALGRVHERTARFQ
jgi:hypothetical protein